MTTKAGSSAAVRARKAKPLSLHLGFNSVSAGAYSGWEGPQSACEFDARDGLQERVAKEAAKLRAKAPADPDEALAQVGAAAHATALVGEFQPAVILVSGCQDNQTSMDGDHNGSFLAQKPFTV